MNITASEQAERVTYNYIFTSLGTVNLSVTLFDRSRNGNTVKLLDQVDPISMSFVALCILFENSELILAATEP